MVSSKTAECLYFGFTTTVTPSWDGGFTNIDTLWLFYEMEDDAPYVLRVQPEKRQGRGKKTYRTVHMGIVLQPYFYNMSVGVMWAESSADKEVIIGS